IFKNVLSRVQIDRLIIQRRICGNARKGTLKFTTVGIDSGRNVLQSIFRHSNALCISLFRQNRDACFKIWWLNIRGEAPFETGTETLFETRKLFWRQIRCDDNLLVVVIKSVKRVEELFNSGFFIRHELDVVNEQDVNVAINLLEGRTFVVPN